MRQPEVARLATLVLALLLAVPVLSAGRDIASTGAFLVEFLTAGAPAPLSWITSPPRVRRRAAGPDVDRFTPRSLRRGRPLVLVHGYAPAGKNDPRAQRAALLLARLGFDVLLPTIPGLTQGRLGTEDVERVVATIAAQRAPTEVMGVSIGAGPALIAAADPRVRDRVSAVVSLGGYASARELVRFFLTGEYGYGDHHGRILHDPATIRFFVAANTDLLDEETRRALGDLDPARAREVLAHPSPPLQGRLEALSPERVAASIPGRLVLIHGRGDRAVPWTESLRLAAARDHRPTTLVVVEALGHVDGPGGGLRWAAVRDLLALWGVMYGLLAGD